MKKIVLSVLTILLVFWHTGAFAQAETTYSEGYFFYTIADESITITGYFGKEKEITLPAMIAGCPVNTIAAGAFQNTSAETLLLPDTITSIEENAIPFGVSVVYNYNVVDNSASAGSSEESIPSSSPEESAQQTPTASQLEVVEVTLEKEEAQAGLSTADEPAVSESAEASEITDKDVQISEEEFAPDTEKTETEEVLSEESIEAIMTTVSVESDEPAEMTAEPEKNLNPLPWCIGALVVLIAAAVAGVLVTRKRSDRR